MPKPRDPDFLASVGRRLIRYRASLDDGRLSERDALLLPQAVQYACQDPRRGLLYVACSNGSPAQGGDRHSLAVVRLSDAGMRLEEPVLPLRGRPVHVCLDAARRMLLLSYNRSPKFSAHAVGQDGMVGPELECEMPGDLNYPHQAVAAPAGAGWVLVCRGTDAHGDRPEEPGSLHLLALDNGRVRSVQAVAPDGGRGFGPRNLAFDARGGMAYVVLERQNRLQAYAFREGRFADGPVASLPTTLGLPTYRPQIAGALRIHPNGRYVYVANRTHMTIGADAQPDRGPGENTIAVYRLDPDSGLPAFMQSAPTRGIHPRTLSIDDSGSLLIAAHVRTATFESGGAYRTVPAGLAIFRIDAEGRLGLLRSQPVDIGEDLLFWSSFIRSADRPDPGSSD